MVWRLVFSVFLFAAEALKEVRATSRIKKRKRRFFIIKNLLERSKPNILKRIINRINQKDNIREFR